MTHSVPPWKYGDGDNSYKTSHTMSNWHITQERTKDHQGSLLKRQILQESTTITLDTPLPRWAISFTRFSRIPLTKDTQKLFPLCCMTKKATLPTWIWETKSDTWGHLDCHHTSTTSSDPSWKRHNPGQTNQLPHDHWWDHHYKFPRTKKEWLYPYKYLPTTRCSQLSS